MDNADLSAPSPSDKGMRWFYIGAGLVLLAIGYGDRQKVEVVSGKLVLKPLPGGEGEKGSTQTAP